MALDDPAGRPLWNSIMPTVPGAPPPAPTGPLRPAPSLADAGVTRVAIQVSEPAVSPISKSAGCRHGVAPASLETRDTADLEICATALPTKYPGACRRPPRFAPVPITPKTPQIPRFSVSLNLNKNQDRQTSSALKTFGGHRRAGISVQVGSMQGYTHRLALSPHRIGLLAVLQNPAHADV